MKTNIWYSVRRLLGVVIIMGVVMGALMSAQAGGNGGGCGGPGGGCTRDKGGSSKGGK